MARNTQNLTGAEMTALGLQYQEAKDAFSAAIHIHDDGTPETMGALSVPSGPSWTRTRST